jgi:Zn-dependent membrane protease YugP
MITYFIIFGGFMLLSWLVSFQLKSRFKKYALIPMNYGMSGCEVAEKMLRDHGIKNVRIVSVKGELTDHYDPAARTINLSHDVYFGKNIAAGAVAAHECGHALQHAGAYSWLRMRSTLVPVVSFASNYVQWVLLAGILVINVFPQLLLAGIGLFAITTIFSFITLPVEIDASQRAMAWLKTAGVTDHITQPKAQDALKWAAFTYVVAALGSLATLMYYIMIYMGRRN